MVVDKKKSFKYFLILVLLLGIVLVIYISKNEFKKKNIINIDPIVINLLTSVHPSLSWNFKPAEPKITVIPGEITSVEYLVENLGDKTTSGIATFSYFPKKFGEYISKLNCFCYDAQTLRPNQKSKYYVVLLIDPEVTKDSKTRNIKEFTIQFTFFDYKEYKENKS
mgnify:CR=1 FL=1|tara:strand:+ start:1049 stop:1546 length:498 start_codon:yes stop_codon:yes gene_type:complete